MSRLETSLAGRFYGDTDVERVPLIFILASPRTGSTMVYQVLINAFGLSYIPNFVNDHCRRFPILGSAAFRLFARPRAVTLQSDHGKTKGWRGPSEGSALFRRWFGGEHPSQTRSCKVLPGQEPHLRMTMASLYAMSGRPIVLKNAWNCFRVEELHRMFPGSLFLWLRRDIGASATSDLRARYRRGSPLVWNSATPANYEAIRERPYWEQVVEQQYEYNATLERDLARVCPRQFLELWYEDLCEHPAGELDRIGGFLASRGLAVRRTAWEVPALGRSAAAQARPDDEARIRDYVNQHLGRLSSHVYGSRKPSALQLQA